MSNRELPSPELLSQLLRYEPESGKLFWLPRGIESFTTLNGCKLWNQKYAQREALSSVTPNGYKRGTLEGGSHFAHRVIWALVYGEWPTKQVDHINHDKLDNRIENLRLVSSRGNNQNRTLSKTNTSGFIGVYSEKGKWCAQIRTKGRAIRLGVYSNIDDAVAARKAAELKFGFHPNHGKR